MFRPLVQPEYATPKSFNATRMNKYITVADIDPINGNKLIQQESMSQMLRNQQADIHNAKVQSISNKIASYNGRLMNNSTGELNIHEFANLLERFRDTPEVHQAIAARDIPYATAVEAYQAAQYGKIAITTWDVQQALGRFIRNNPAQFAIFSIGGGVASMIFVLGVTLALIKAYAKYLKSLQK